MISKKIIWNIFHLYLHLVLLSKFKFRNNQEVENKNIQSKLTLVGFSCPQQTSIPLSWVAFDRMLASAFMHIKSGQKYLFLQFYSRHKVALSLSSSQPLNIFQHAQSWCFLYCFLPYIPSSTRTPVSSRSSPRSYLRCEISGFFRYSNWPDVLPKCR